MSNLLWRFSARFCRFNSLKAPIAPRSTLQLALNLFDFRHIACSDGEVTVEDDVQHVNEFYKKGCQEKSSASTGGERLFLEIQPTLFRYL